MRSGNEWLTLGLRPKTSINKPCMVLLKDKKKEKRKKHLEVKPCLSHAQAELCSKHDPRTGPTIVWAGLKRGTCEAFEHNIYVPLKPEMPTKREVKYRMRIFGSVKSTWLYFSWCCRNLEFFIWTNPLDVFVVFAGSVQ